MRVVIPPDLHPLVRKALRALKPDPRLSYRPELDDKLLRTPRGFIQIAVAREHTERAGRLLDMFVRTIEGPDVRGRVLVQENRDAEVERERQRRAWDEQERRETEERQRREREKARRAELLADARAWREASLLRDYAAAVLQARGPDDEAQQRCATWVCSVANEMDPLTQNGSAHELDS